MVALLVVTLSLAGALKDNESFVQAQVLYRSGDPVAAEVMLGPLLEEEHSAPERAKVLVWAAMCADMSGRMEIAQGRVAEAVMLEPTMRLPPEMSLRLARLVEELRAQQGEQETQKTSATRVSAVSPRPSADAKPSPPPPPSTSSDTVSAETTEAAAPAETAAEVPDNKASSSSSDSSPQTNASSKPSGKTAAQPPVEEGATVTVSTSLWAVAGAALTVTMLLGVSASVIAIYGGLTYYETLAVDAMDVDLTRQAVFEALRLSGMLAAGGAAASVVAAAAAGGAWWLDQE